MTDQDMPPVYDDQAEPYDPPYEPAYAQEYDQAEPDVYAPPAAVGPDSPTMAAPAAHDAPPPARGGLLRNGLVRALLVGVVIVIAVIVLIGGGLSLLKSSHNQPIAVDTYPGATVVTQAKTGNSDTATYTTADPIDKVGGFYASKWPNANEAENGCFRLNTDSQRAQEADPKLSTLPGHYYYRCVVDSSMLEVQQLVTVTITYQADPAIHTQIVVARQWGNAQ